MSSVCCRVVTCTARQVVCQSSRAMLYVAEAPCRFVQCTAVQERLGRTRAASSSMTAAGSASSHHRSQRRRPLPAAPTPPSAVASLPAPSRCAAAAAASMSWSGRLATWTSLHCFNPAAAPLRGCKRTKYDLEGEPTHRQAGRSTAHLQEAGGLAGVTGGNCVALCTFASHGCPSVLLQLKDQLQFCCALPACSPCTR